MFWEEALGATTERTAGSMAMRMFRDAPVASQCTRGPRGGVAMRMFRGASGEGAVQVAV